MLRSVRLSVCLSLCPIPLARKVHLRLWLLWNIIRKAGAASRTRYLIFETLLLGAAGEPETGGGHLSFGAAAGVVLVLVVVVALAVITDLSCYFVNRCGVTMCICRSLGRAPREPSVARSQSREKAAEEGERSVANASLFRTTVNARPGSARPELYSELAIYLFRNISAAPN